MLPSFTHRTVSPGEIEIESGAKNPTHGFGLPSQPAMSPTETTCVAPAIVVLVVVAGTVVVVVELVVDEVVVEDVVVADGCVLVVGAMVEVEAGGLLVEVAVAEATVVEFASEVEAVVEDPNELVVVPAVGVVREEAGEVAV